MVAGKLRAVVCTSTLDLGIDWGDVDLVINVGAPKGASRLAQRIGRANHRLDEPSKALLVPANRFEVVECQAALEAAEEGAQDTPPSRPGALDVLAQHVLGMACAAPFDPRRALSRGDERLSLSGPDAGGLRPDRAIRGDRRLCARQLRPLRQAEADAGRPLAHRPSAHRPAIPPQCRHHRRGADAAGAARPPPKAARLRPRACWPRAACSARSRNISSSSSCPATPSSSPARCCASRACARPTPSSRAPTPPSPRSRPMTAANSRSRPISPTRVRELLADPRQLVAAAGPSLRLAAPAERTSRSCPGPTRSWSRPSRAATSTISSATPSRAGSPIRASACC